MPIKRTYGCSECGHTWQFLHMTRGEPAQPCPNGCVAKPQAGLSAPAVGRGALPTGTPVPTSQSKREQMAADMALKNTGMGDVTANQKIGDIAAKTIPIDKSVPNDLRAQLTPSFVTTSHAGYAGAAADPYKARNLSIFGGGRNLPSVAQAATKLYPGKRG